MTDPAIRPGEASAADLTLEEKAALTSGSDFWHTEPIERAGVKGIMMTDGPHGLRKQSAQGDHLGIGGSGPATCFPPATGLASSFDPELAERVGAAIGREAAIEDVSVVLGPGVNIKRTPLCGRNFEYFSEDPVLAATLGTGLVRGIQSQGVGASVKHFAANNQETERARISVEIDERPLREIYLRAFQGVIEDADPWTVMCSYNRVGGEYVSESLRLLTGVLREEWGFDGIVVSDWGAVNDRVAGILAGMDLEMPSSGGRTDAEIVRAVRDGSLDEAALDRVVERLLELVRRASRRPAVTGPLDEEAHHALAREAATRSMVLLKNDGGLLPLRTDQRIAVIGAFAERPRYQGAGSSHINPTRLDVALEKIREVAGDVTYAAGYPLAKETGMLGIGGGEPDDADPDHLRAEAVAAAADAEVAVVFLGLPAAQESEGFDREHLDLPPEQLRMLDEVLAVNSRVVVVLSHGGVVTLPFAERVPAILEGWLLGQAGGSATADVLFGTANPSGRLAETVPLRLEDTPAYLDFPGENGRVRYGEGLFVGYRWYDARRIPVAFPFGHGLSYTTFGYGEATARRSGDDVLVTVPVTNTGSRAGREVVQAYVSLDDSRVTRPPRELKAFASIHLEPGETREVELVLRRRDLAYWDERVDRWIVEPGEYGIAIGSSSADLRAHASIELDGDEVVVPLTWQSSIGDLFAHPVAGPRAREAFEEGRAGGNLSVGEMQRMMESFPLKRLPAFGVPEELLAGFISAAE